MTITLQPVRDWSDVTANFDALARLFKQPVKAIDFGTMTLTWPGGSANSNALVQAHALGVTPVVVLLIPFGFGAGGLTQGFTVPNVTARAAANFTAQTRTQDSSVPPNTATQPYGWLAVA